MDLYTFLIYFIIFSLPILTTLTRKFSLPYNDKIITELHDKSFHSYNYSFIQKNTSFDDALNITNYPQARIYFKAENKILELSITLSKGNYYNEKRINFNIKFDINQLNFVKPSLNNTMYNFLNLSSEIEKYNDTSNNYTFNILKNFDQQNMSITFQRFKEDITIINQIITKNLIDYYLENIFIGLKKNNSELDCILDFKEFNLTINLQKEKLTYKFFYILMNFINGVLYFISFILFDTHKSTIDNISYIFLVTFVSKLFITEYYIYKELLEVGFSILKILKFYFHLIVYQEMILSISDIFSFILYSVTLGISYTLGTQLFSFNIKTILITFAYIFPFVVICDSSNKIIIQLIPILIALLFAIVKQLRSSTYRKNQLIELYSSGTVFYWLFVLNYNIIEFCRSYLIFAFLYFAIIFCLCRLLCFIIESEIICKYLISNKDKIGKEEFENLKSVNCCICQLGFEKSEIFNNKIFYKISISKTKCNHYFHDSCLRTWKERKNICPLCRRRL